MLDITKTIVVIEDDMAQIGLMQEIVKDLCLDVELKAFASGKEYLQYKNETMICPSLIILDLVLPREDGLTILKQLRQELPMFTPIIIWTSSTSRMDLLRAYQYGATAFVIKPYNLDELFKKIAATIVFWFGVAEPPGKLGEDKWAKLT